MSDLISREEAIDAIRFGITYAKKINKETGEAELLFKSENEELEKAVLRISEIPSSPIWSGFYSEPKDDNSIYGKKLMEDDTIYLLGIEGRVRQECGAWGWGSAEYVPWEQLQAKVPHNNNPAFCYCDNFISFWELKWNFDDGYDWDGVPYIKHEPGEESGG